MLSFFPQLLPPLSFSSPVPLGSQPQISLPLIAVFICVWGNGVVICIHNLWCTIHAGTRTYMTLCSSRQNYYVLIQQINPETTYSSKNMPPSYLSLPSSYSLKAGMYCIRRYLIRSPQLHIIWQVRSSWTSKQSAS